MKFKNDFGRSMMEMILYLGLVVVLTASTLKMYADSVEKTRLVEFETTIDDLKENVNNYFLGRALPGDDGWTSFLNDAYKGSLYNPWGGNITLTTGTIAAAPYNKMFYTTKLENLQQPQCISVANAFVGKEAFAVNIGGTALTGNNLNIGSIASECVDGTNTVTGYFYKE